MDDITKVDTDAKLHAAIWFNGGIALSHRSLDGKRALDCVHDAGELCKDAVAGGVDNAPAVLADHWQDDRLVSLEVPNRARLIGAHQRTVPSDVGGKNCR